MLFDEYYRERHGVDPDPWDESTIPGIVKPQVTHKTVSDAAGEKFLILDSVREPIDSTRNAGKVEGLIEHWQAALYGGAGNGKRAREPGED